MNNENLAFGACTCTILPKCPTNVFALKSLLLNLMTSYPGDTGRICSWSSVVTGHSHCGSCAHQEEQEEGDQEN